MSPPVDVDVDVDGDGDGDVNDTIAAIATPPGSGGIGIVRLSGPGAAAIAARVVDREPTSLPDRVLTLAIARDPATGARLDEVLVAVMRAPHSYTGEDVAEIHGHGGAVNMARLLRATFAAGARAAEPGEFTRRAFTSGRLDLTQAEAVLGIIEASSERSLRLAQGQLEGQLGARVGELRRRTTELLAELEAGIDFPEEGLAFAGAREIGRRASAVADECAALAGTFAAGRAIREGVAVALVGEVNAGKSSLFNRLVGRERTLVAEEPGTTRDFVEAEVVWGGIAVTLIDTAGRRDAESAVEKRGIELGAERARQADLEIELVAVERGMGERELEQATGDRRPTTPGWSSRQVHTDDLPGRQATGDRRRKLRVISKGEDLPGEFPGVVTSAVSGRGVEELKRMVVEMAMGGGGDGDGVMVTSERQRALVADAGAALSRCAVAAAEGKPEEVLALEVREASQSLARVMGETVGDEVLDEVFARFCIGK